MVRLVASLLISQLILLFPIQFAQGFHFDLPTIHSVQASVTPLQHAVNSFAPLDISTETLSSALIAVDENPFENAYSVYQKALKTDPMQTKILTGIVLAIVGDAIAQAREPNPYDTKRAYAFAAFDGCYRAVQQITYPPIIQFFQGAYLSGLMASLGVQVSPDTVSLLAALEQTLCSQLVIIPLIYYPVFYAVTGTVQGLSFDQTITRAKETFIPLMKRNLLFWIPVQFVVFGYIEENLQIPILILCGLVWTIILSVSAGATKSQEEVTGQDEVYCVTGMEDNCLIDPDDLFQTSSSNAQLINDDTIGNAEAFSASVQASKANVEQKDSANADVPARETEEASK